MGELIELYGFLAVLIRAVTLALETLTVGGVIFSLVCLPGAESQIVARTRRFLTWCAAFLAAAAVCSALLAGLVLHGSAADLPWYDLLNTTFARSDILMAASATGLAILAAGSGPAGWMAIPAVLVVAGSLM